MRPTASPSIVQMTFSVRAQHGCSSISMGMGERGGRGGTHVLFKPCEPLGARSSSTNPPELVGKRFGIVLVSDQRQPVPAYSPGGCASQDRRAGRRQRLLRLDGDAIGLGFLTRNKSEPGAVRVQILAWLWCQNLVGAGQLGLPSPIVLVGTGPAVRVIVIRYEAFDCQTSG